MTLPALANWDSTRQALHQAAQVVGAIKQVSVERLPNYAHLGLYVYTDGLTSGRLSDGAELRLNINQSSVLYNCPAGNVSTIALQGHTQATLTDAVLNAMQAAGHPASIDRSHVADQSSFTLIPATAMEYQQALHSVYSAIARFRGRLLGNLSPMIIFPHGFDLSFMWFKRGAEERTDPHLNFGFSPGSAGFPRPYIYSYASPLPDGYFDVKLPTVARFTRDTWKGIVIDYDTLASASDHESLLEQTLVDIQAAVAPLLV
jgi:hypothetical protein